MKAIIVIEQHLGNAACAIGIFIAAKVAKARDLDVMYSLAPSARSRLLIIYSDVSSTMPYLLMKMYAKNLASTSSHLLRTRASFWGYTKGYTFRTELQRKLSTSGKLRALLLPISKNTIIKSPKIPGEAISPGS